MGGVIVPPAIYLTLIEHGETSNCVEISPRKKSVCLELFLCGAPSQKWGGGLSSTTTGKVGGLGTSGKAPDRGDTKGQKEDPLIQLPVCMTLCVNSI
jgi:hypothetical protein